MDPRVQIVALLGSGGMLLVVLELVRRRRLLERYALLWLFSALVLVALAAWGNLLEEVSALIGIAYPPTALFVIAFGFTLALLLHFSVAVSRQADQTKVLAQRQALLEERLRNAEARLAERAAGEHSSPRSMGTLEGEATGERQAGARVAAVRSSR
jgi:hypothetical protein